MIKNPGARAETARMGVYTAIAGAVAAGFTYLAPHNTGGEAPNTAALEARVQRYHDQISEMRQEIATMRVEISGKIATTKTDLQADVRNVASISRQSDAELRQWVQMLATTGGGGFSNPPPAPVLSLSPPTFEAPWADAVGEAVEDEDPPEVDE